MSHRLKPQKPWWGKLKALPPEMQGKLLCHMCQRDILAYALKETLLGLEFRCKILTDTWEALVEQIRDEMAVKPGAVESLLTQIYQDQYVLRQEVKKKKESPNGSSNEK